MIRNPLRLSIAFCMLVSIFLCINAHAGISIIVTAPPPLREVITEPPGYTNCYVVPQEFYNGVWHYQHRVCEYDNDRNTGIWIAGYWQCTGFASGGRCTRNAWVASHWLRPRDRDYRRYYHRNQHQHYENRYSHGNTRHGHSNSSQVYPDNHVHHNNRSNYHGHSNQGPQNANPNNHHGHNDRY